MPLITVRMYPDRRYSHIDFHWPYEKFRKCKKAALLAVENSKHLLFGLGGQAGYLTRVFD